MAKEQTITLHSLQELGAAFGITGQESEAKKLPEKPENPKMVERKTDSARCSSRSKVPESRMKLDLRSFIAPFEGHLAWGLTENGRKGWNTHEDACPYIRILDQKWYFHQSIRGLEELLAMIYGEQARLKWLPGKDTVVIGVPSDQVKFWIGVGGRMAKFIAERLGIARLSVESI